jgi:hypothetical protein
MTQARQAIHLSVIYSIPLLLWVSAQLQLIDWNSASLAFFSRQAQGALILLQVFAIALLFTLRPQQNMRDDLLSILLITVYPLPFLAIIWLTGSTSAAALALGVALVGAAGVIAFVLRSGARLVRADARMLQTCLALIHIMLATLVWNFRGYWSGLLE